MHYTFAACTTCRQSEEETKEGRDCSQRLKTETPGWPLPLKAAGQLSVSLSFRVNSRFIKSNSLSARLPVAPQASYKASKSSMAAATSSVVGTPPATVL